jgi:hypothetical protein
MATEIVTLQLPESLYRAARRVAEATDQSLEAVLQASIAHALPPLEDVSDNQAAELAALALLGDGALWQAARAKLSAGEQAELRTLLERHGAGDLSEAEQTRLRDLLDSHGRLTVRKAYAYLLLARRGFRVPIQDDAG